MSHRRACSLLLIVPLALAGCGASRSMPAGAPVAKVAGQTAARGLTRTGMPATSPMVGNGGAFLTELGASSPNFSPRGDRLAFTTPSRGVLVAGPDGTSPVPLAGSLPGDHDPAFSPAGDALAVVRAGAAGGSAIVRIDLTSAQVTTLYTSPSALRQPAWLPAGRGLVFVQDSGQSMLMRWDAATSKASTVWQGMLAGSPTVSPDGAAIVFEATGTSPLPGLTRIALQTLTVTPLSVLGAHPRSPRFSTTGRSLAYVADDGLYVAAADGTGAKRVAGGTGFEGLAWRPSLPQLVVGATQGSRTDLQRVDLPAR